MKVKLVGSQYKVLSKYFEDLSKASILSTFGGYFLPSVLSSGIRPTFNEAIFGLVTSVGLLIFSLGLIKKGGK